MKPSSLSVPIFATGLLCLWTQVDSAATPSSTGATKTAAAPVLPALTAQQIMEKNMAARGGATAWKAVQSISFKGNMGAGGTVYEAVTAKKALERKERPEMLLPFTLTLKRPHKSRLELTFNGQTAVQVYDGVAGYKYRPFLGRNGWDPYSAEELRLAAAEPGIDGLLVNAASNGRHVESAGTDMVEGNPAYRLRATRADGKVLRVWIDAKSFLEVKEEGEPRKLDARMHPVSVYLRDYRLEQGLMIPHVIETEVQGVTKTEKITVDSVQLNPKMDDLQFTKPK